MLINTSTVLRWPVLHRKFINVGEPERGDIAVFRWPVDTSLNYIKRIIGMPGDNLRYVNKQWIINGEPVPQQFKSYTTNIDSRGRSIKVEQRLEKLNGKEYTIYIRPDRMAEDFVVDVPPGHYFAVGDNRDDSSDSRYWGFVPEENLVGRAALVWMSWDPQAKRIRWNRIGERIND